MERVWSSRVLILAVIGALLLFSSFSSAAASGKTPILELNHAAPNFSRMALDDSRVALFSFRGKVVLLNFWASWCGPCLLEIPRFVAWQREYGGQGLQVIGVSMDDEEMPALGVYRKYAVNYPVMMGDAKLGELYGGILGLPVTFLIDKHGVIRFIHRGAANMDGMQGEIQTLLRSH